MIIYYYMITKFKILYIIQPYQNDFIFILGDVRRVLVVCSILYCVILNRIIHNRPIQLLHKNAVKIYSVGFEFERTIFSKTFEFEFEFLMGSDLGSVYD
jgi:hypothetical protein